MTAICYFVDMAMCILYNLDKAYTLHIFHLKSSPIKHVWFPKHVYIKINTGAAYWVPWQNQPSVIIDFFSTVQGKRKHRERISWGDAASKDCLFLKGCVKKRNKKCNCYSFTVIVILVHSLLFLTSFIIVCFLILAGFHSSVLATCCRDADTVTHHAMCIRH